jgi:hypothetical protein
MNSLKKRLLESLIVISAVTSLCLGFLSVFAADPTIRLTVSAIPGKGDVRITGTVKSTLDQAVALDLYYGETVDAITTLAPTPFVNTFVGSAVSEPIDFTVTGLKEDTNYYLTVVNHYDRNLQYFGPVKIRTLKQEIGYNGSQVLTVNLSATYSKTDEIRVTGTVTSPTKQNVTFQAYYGTEAANVSTAGGSSVSASLDPGTTIPIDIIFTAKAAASGYFVKVIGTRTDQPIAGTTGATQPGTPLTYFGPVKVSTPIKEDIKLGTAFTYGTKYLANDKFSVVSSQNTAFKEGGSVMIEGKVTALAPASPHLKIAWGSEQGKLINITDMVFNRPLNTGESVDFTYEIVGLDPGTTYYYTIIDSATPDRAYTAEATITPTTFATDPSVPAADVPTADPGIIQSIKDQFSGEYGLIPCDGSQEDPCTFPKLVQLANTIIKFLIALALPIFAVLFAYAGFMYLKAGAVGDSEAHSKALKIAWHAFAGLVIVLVAWLLVSSLLSWLLADSFKSTGDGGSIINLMGQ